MKYMFKTLVTPHIDYNSQLWMPIYRTEIEKIEKIQRDYYRYNNNNIFPWDN